MDITHRGYLGAGALCRACFEPFGRLEDRKSPYSIQCGHTLCLRYWHNNVVDIYAHSCLNDGRPNCQICGAGYDALMFSRLCNLGVNGPPQPPIYTNIQRGDWLQEAMSEVNAITGLHYMRHLYDTTRSFLDLQPGSQFRDLSISSGLLKIAIDSKCSGQNTQTQLTHDLSGQIDTLNNENNFLRRQLEEMDDERKYIEDHIGGLMRRDPLMESEVVDFRREMNDLREQVIQLHRAHDSDLFIPPLPENLATPEIQIQPASRPPSPSRSSLGSRSPPGSKSPSPLILWSPTHYGHRVETQYGTGTAIHSFERSDDSNTLGIHSFEQISAMPELAPSSASDSDWSPPPSPRRSHVSTGAGSDDEESEGGPEEPIRIVGSSAPLYQTLFGHERQEVDASGSPNERDTSLRPQAIYSGTNNSSTVRFQFPEEEYPGSASFAITAPNSPAATDMSMMTSSIRLLRTPEHEEQRTRFDLASRLTSPNPVDDRSSPSIPPSPSMYMDNLLNEVNNYLPLPDAVFSSAQNVNSGTSGKVSTPSLRPGIADNATSRIRPRGGPPSTMSRALVRSRSTPSLRHSSSSSYLAVPSSTPDFAVLTSNRRLTRIATVLLEVLVHLMATSSISLDWEEVQSSIYEGMREDERQTLRGMLDVETVSTPEVPPTRPSSRGHRRHRSESPEPPQRCWTPS
ncbi:hypothetical protein CVT25_012495 [Psilocybe cyanescens]|uniref:Uncharacterized protein n=1 Tax=Psilocybe cyanescens TaxID=93625 RepID=A0A409X0Z1_PSICY|nr:hypothetical protein CVT25_012495 [Psilocybe cyanescens]